MGTEEYWQGGEWREFAPRPAINLAVPALTASASLFTGRALLVGWALHCAGGPGGFQIIDGQDARGELIADQNLPTGGSQEGGPGFPGLRIQQGIYLVISAVTSLSGGIWIVPRNYRGMDSPRPGPGASDGQPAHGA